MKSSQLALSFFTNYSSLTNCTPPYGKSAMHHRSLTPFMFTDVTSFTDRRPRRYCILLSIPIAMATRSLHPRDLWSLLRPTLQPGNPARSSGLAVCVRPHRPSDIALAALLSRNPPEPVHILCPPTCAPLLRHLSPSASIHQLSPSQTLRPFARWALEHHVSDLVLGHTRVDAAVHALSSIDAGLPDAFVGGKSNGIEMLPPGTITLHRPLQSVHEHPLDIAVSDLLPPEHYDPALSEAARAARELGEGISVSAVLRHGARKRQLISRLCSTSDELIRAAVLEASHWGYIVVRRSTLAARFHDGHAGRLAAVHAVARMALHVSGSADQLTLDDEHVARLTADLLRLDESSTQLLPLPKGRTAAGMVVRPATGRFAKRLAQADRRTARTGRRPRGQSLTDAIRGEFADVPDDLMIFTREPDQESGGLKSRRLRGNWASVPVRTDTPGAGTYWDNRFIMAAAPVAELAAGQPTVLPRQVMLAALNTQDVDMQPRLANAELYVRQIRRADWERITSSVSRVRGFQIPFQCIRALPAVFQKTPGEFTPGHLVASPHLGLSARPDLYFTAVRMPRYRCLPEDIDPGFTEEHFRPDTESDSGHDGDSHKSRRRKRGPEAVTAEQ